MQTIIKLLNRKKFDNVLGLIMMPTACTSRFPQLKSGVEALVWGMAGLGEMIDLQHVESTGTLKQP